LLFGLFHVLLKLGLLMQRRNCKQPTLNKPKQTAEWQDALTASGRAPNAAAALGALVLGPAAEEAFFRGYLLPSLVSQSVPTPAAVRCPHTKAMHARCLFGC
jgi:membrane protease YdiL (CAAX protease family)